MLDAAPARDSHGVLGDIVVEDAAMADVAGELVSPSGAPAVYALLPSASASEASTTFEIPGGLEIDHADKAVEAIGCRDPHGIPRAL